MRFHTLAVVCILIAAISASGCLQSTEKTTDEILPKDHFRSVTDSRGGVEVIVPADIERVATVSDGLVEEVMFILGVDDTLIGLGSNGLLSESAYQYPLDDGGEATVTGGKNVALVLSPHLKDLPLFIDYGVAMNVETLASLEPDVVIMRLQFRTSRWQG
ncbi:hypothetical protein [Methanogenium cariaci]|uniref:hypothetical protein n=1 Tax=Methanogenium cariaci TaxID=2197 RepID=UPI001FDF7F55|nr:hypothetical protein [Methanogenium cariaci]